MRSNTVLLEQSLPLALVVEDNPVLRSVARRVLQQLGYDVRTASDGLSGVSVAEMTSFAVVLMDVQMPVLDGLECTRRIRRMELSTGEHATVIGISAASSAEQCTAAGMDAFLQKPLNIESLKDILFPGKRLHTDLFQDVVRSA